MKIDKDITNLIESLTLVAGEHRKVDQPGRYFLLQSNSLTTDVQISIGGRSYQPWPVLYSARVEKEDDFFSFVRFYNPTASPMTIEYIISNLIIDNKATVITGSVVLLIDDTSNGTSTPPSILVLPNTMLIDGSPAVNVGGGVVGIPLTAQPFNTGDNVTITNCPQYNGAYVVLASSGVNQVDITVTFKGGLIDNAAAVDVGGGVVGIPITGHPYSTDETITITGTVNYDGDYPVLASSTANQVNITVAYNAETFDGVDDSHNLTFDNTDDSIGLASAQSIPACATRKELHIANHDATYKVFWGDSDVDADSYRGIPIMPESIYIIPCTDQIFLSGENGAGVAGCRVSWSNKTKV